LKHMIYFRVEARPPVGLDTNINTFVLPKAGPRSPSHSTNTAKIQTRTSRQK
jgi:hypothetical protein